MQTRAWNPWSIFDEACRTVVAAAGSQEWPVFDIEDNENEMTLTGDLPGMTDADIELTIMPTRARLGTQRMGTSKEALNVGRPRDIPAA